VLAVPIALGFFTTLSFLIFFAPLWIPTIILVDSSSITYLQYYGVTFSLIFVFVGWCAWGDRIFPDDDYIDIMWISALVQMLSVVAFLEIFH
jgi:hypothetical protein